MLAEAGGKVGGGDAGELADGANAHGLELGARHLAHAPEAGDGQRPEELRLATEGNHHEAVGLLEVGGDLGHEHVRGNPHGGGEVDAGLDHRLDGPGDGGAVTVKSSTRRHVEKGLVDGHGLHERGEAGEDAHDLAGDRGVLVHVHGQEDALRAEAEGAADGHGGMDAEAAGLIGCCGHHPRPRGSAPTITGRPRVSGRSRCSTDA